MESSRKSKSSDLVSHVARAIGGIVEHGDRVVLALSGGVDSVVLFDVLRRVAGRMGFRLSAIHVDHQLSPNASRWARFCREMCRSHDVPLRVARVTVPRGNSVEAAARMARHEAFRRLRADYVVLGHNQDDQAETVLLQLLRGAGVKGLSAMPLLRKDEGGGRKAEGGPSILRPLLDVPRSEIERYARAGGLKWVEDESNAESYFLRNFLRREVLPVIAQRFPGYRATLARAARNFAEAAEMLDELGLADGAEHGPEEALPVSVLRDLTQERAKNVLRRFLATRGVRMPNSQRLGEVLRQALTAREDARVRIDVGDCDMRRFAGALYLAPKLIAIPTRFCQSWNGERRLELPELGGVLTMARHRGGGIDPVKLGKGAVTIRVRCGGERLRPDCKRPSRSLRNLFQEAGVPPWQRAGLPLLFCGDTLVWAPGIGVDCEFQAQHDALRPLWRSIAPRRR